MRDGPSRSDCRRGQSEVVGGDLQLDGGHEQADGGSPNGHLGSVGHEWPGKADGLAFIRPSASPVDGQLDFVFFLAEVAEIHQHRRSLGRRHARDQEIAHGAPGCPARRITRTGHETGARRGTVGDHRLGGIGQRGHHLDDLVTDLNAPVDLEDCAESLRPPPRFLGSALLVGHGLNLLAVSGGYAGANRPLRGRIRTSGHRLSLRVDELQRGRDLAIPGASGCSRQLHAASAHR
jgi:hypothetical protein